MSTFNMLMHLGPVHTLSLFWWHKICEYFTFHAGFDALCKGVLFSLCNYSLTSAKQQPQVFSGEATQGWPAELFPWLFFILQSGWKGRDTCSQKRHAPEPVRRTCRSSALLLHVLYRYLMNNNLALQSITVYHLCQHSLWDNIPFC